MWPQRGLTPLPIPLLLAPPEPEPSASFARLADARLAVESHDPRRLRTACAPGSLLFDLTGQLYSLFDNSLSVL